MSLNEQIFLVFNGGHTEFLDSFLSICTAAPTWIPFYVLCAVALTYRYGWQKALMMTVAIGIAVGLSDFVCAKIIRPHFKVLRPGNLDNPFSEFVTVVNNKRGGKYGFPSCHAANCFAFAVGMCMLTKDNLLRILMLTWAIFICYTRIYVGKHYPSDLLAGALVGSIFGAICTSLIKYYGIKLRFYTNSKGIAASSSPMPQYIIYAALLLTLLSAAIYSAMITI